jgi:hypothetical protein
MTRQDHAPLAVTRFASWAPGIMEQSGGGAWLEWARGRRKIALSPDGPALDFAGSQWLRLKAKEFALFKRRLSQISKMTIQVLHDIMPIGGATPIVFVSFRGEIQQQFKINRMLALEGDISPAAFSQSVFNTPPALAAIALGLCAGYSAVYPGNGRFADGLLAAAAPLLAGAAKEIALVYADELCPPEYGCTRPDPPLAFAALLSAQEPAAHEPAAHGPNIPLAFDRDPPVSPADFLKRLYLNGADA